LEGRVSDTSKLKVSFSLIILFVVLFSGACAKKEKVQYESCKPNVTIPVNCSNLKTKNYCVDKNGTVVWKEAGNIDFDIDFNNGPFAKNPITSSSGQTSSESPTKSGDFKYTIKCKNNQVEDPMFRVP
jgi:hypothetical protein